MMSLFQQNSGPSRKRNCRRLRNLQIHNQNYNILRNLVLLATLIFFIKKKSNKWHLLTDLYSSHKVLSLVVYNQMLLFGPHLFTLHGEATQNVMTHLLACFTVMGTPCSIKTDNGPAYISRHFKQFLQSFSIKHIKSIPYNPQTQDIVKHITH